ncbi:MAG TPA: M20 family metallopeptidase [Acidimicrobiales bacterium]|nr:M20 family metallopeptidase [Acidimicrobiales bacterium]
MTPDVNGEVTRGGEIHVDDREALDFAVRLVQIRSVDEPGVSNESEATQLVIAKMREWGWSPELAEVAPGRSNIIVDVSGGGLAGPILAFEGHLDVVSEGDASQWSVDPFGGEVVDGRLFGRGAADMKAGVVSMLFGVRALQLAGPFPGTIRILALVDEEGMMLGAKHAVNSGALDGVAGVIVCEPEGDEVCPVSKGAVRLRIDLNGQMTHGAMPDEGRNPLPTLGRVLGALEDIQRDLQTRHGAHPHLGETYVTPTVVEAGTPPQMNTIPARSSLWVDIRSIPGVDHDHLIERIRTEAAKLGASDGIDAEVTVIDNRPPVDTSVEDPVVTCLVEAHTRLTGSAPLFGGVPGTTDGTIFTRDAKVPTVVYGPGGKWIAHQVDEFVEVEAIGRYALAYALAARNFLSRDL